MNYLTKKLTVILSLTLLFIIAVIIMFSHRDIPLNELKIKGNNIEKIIETLKLAKDKLGQKKPIAILLHTEMGNGVDFMMHTHAWHGKAPNDEQLKDALAQNKQTLGDY